MDKSSILKDSIGKLKPAVMPTPSIGVQVKPVKMPQPKAPEINSPYAKPLMPNPAGITNPGTFFRRPKPFAPTGKLVPTDNQLGNFRTLGTTVGQNGPKTLPTAKSNILKSKITSVQPKAGNASFSK